MGGHESVIALVERYYLAEVIAIGVTVVGVYFLYKGILAGKGEGNPDSLRGILAGAISSRKDLAIGASAAVLYALLYLFVSGVIIFQPGTNQAAWAGISGPSWTAAACCGSVGTVPVLVFYASPQAHLAFQVLPLDALFAVVIPLLVGFNVTVAANSVRNRKVRKSVGWMSSMGVLAGLFTGCPTCAGLFLASAVGGVGATTLAIALAPYQMLFVVVSIPLLVASPLLIALNSRRALKAACALPLSS